MLDTAGQYVVFPSQNIVNNNHRYEKWFPLNAMTVPVSYFQQVHQVYNLCNFCGCIDVVYLRCIVSVHQDPVRLCRREIVPIIDRLIGDQPIGRSVLRFRTGPIVASVRAKFRVVPDSTNSNAARAGHGRI